MLTRFGLLLLLLLALHRAYSTGEAKENEGFCTTADCPQVKKAHETREVEEVENEEGEHYDSFYTGAYLDRSVELLRTENTFFAHLFERVNSSENSTLNGSSTTSHLEYLCPGLLFSFNAIYLPGHCAVDSVVPKEGQEPGSSRYFVKYRCHRREDNRANLPSADYSLATAPVTSLGLEPYFGIPTPASLAILVARFEHNISLPCDQISPLGLTTSDPGLDPSSEVALLVGNGLESRRVRLADLVADGQRLMKEESSAAADK